MFGTVLKSGACILRDLRLQRENWIKTTGISAIASDS
jgi:hypothetical protein